MTRDFAFYESLPFADGAYSTTPRITEPILFQLAKDGRDVTLLVAHSPEDLPLGLVDTLHSAFNYVVEEGRTYPHYKPMDRPEFEKYCFENFAAVLVEGNMTGNILEKTDWDEAYLGHFYIKPNYIGRCLHVCNAGFIVNHQKRGLGLGKELGRKYLDLAPRLGYAYSVFNLVFETNPASARIWDSLGFEKIGYIPKVAVLKGELGLVGAYVYGKDLQKKEEKSIEKAGVKRETSVQKSAEN